jgi:dienelactone hydrolase
MFQRTDIAFEAEGGVTLRGWLYVPTGGTGPYPAITMAHGYAGVKEHGLERFAEKFASNGFVVLLHDHRNFGASDGTPRQDIDPWRQVADWRRAISFLEHQDDVDAKRIGLWGTSYSGGHALVLGATERRLRAVVAQVPTISGFEQGLRRIPPDAVAAIEDAFAADERAQARGAPPRRQTIVSADPAIPASYRAKDAIEFYLQPVPDGAWENSVTVRSTRAARMYEPGTWIARVSPTPLLMIVLVTIPGGHFDPYITRFDQSSAAALDWFKEHLA